MGQVNGEVRKQDGSRVQGFGLVEYITE
jgi:hypothetical protein